MKIRNIFTAVLALPALLLSACSDDDSNWNPGPETENVHQVYFDNPLSETEIEPNTAAGFTVKFYRNDDRGAISVPLTIEGSDIFDAPATVDFADGETSAEVTVAVTPSNVTGLHECTIKIPDGPYSSPYSKEYTAHTLRLTIIQWVPYAENARVYGSTDYKRGGEIDPTMPAYTTTLYKADGMDRYYVMIGDQKMVFTTVASDALGKGVHYVYPMGGYTGKDPYDGSAAWYFAADPDDSCKIHWPGTEGYLDYCQIYLGVDSYDYTIFNTGKNYICLSIFTYKYDAADTYINYAYEYIYVDWNSEN